MAIKRKKKVLFVFGTRPEAIKLAPLIKEFQKDTKNFIVETCSTGQHKEMLGQVVSFFSIPVDYNLNLMQYDQSVSLLTQNGLHFIEAVVQQSKPDLIMVQGDTTTAFIGALAGYYAKIPVAHIEAGLRSNNKYAPFPEEVNRKLIDHIADFHFAPVKSNVSNLRKEGFRSNIWCVGNTVIDALFLTLTIIKKSGLEKKYINELKNIDFTKKTILITAHRRENLGKPLTSICSAINELAKLYSDVNFIFPVHLNPRVYNTVNRHLRKNRNIYLLPPLDYPLMVWIMSKSFCILTDSGGIQEEAPSLHKPVLVLRDVTERPEAISSGSAFLVGTEKAAIIKKTRSILDNQKLHKKMISVKNPFGDGNSSQKIVSILKNKILIA